MSNGQKWNEFTPEQLAQLDARKWSDILSDVAELKSSVARIENTFTQAQGALVFVKWMSAIAVSGAACWAWISAHLTIK